MENNPTTEATKVDNENNVEVQEKTFNIYPLFRHLFLFFCIFLVLAIIFILIYHNGKSIYENGI